MKDHLRKLRNRRRELMMLFTKAPRNKLSLSLLRRTNKTKKPKEKVVTESSKEFIPSKYGVLKRLRKLSYKKQTSSKDQSPTILKPHLNRQGVKVHESPALVSPSSKKRRVEDMAKHITEKRKKRKLVVREESSDSVIVP